MFAGKVYSQNCLYRGILHAWTSTHRNGWIHKGRRTAIRLTDFFFFFLARVWHCSLKWSEKYEKVVSVVSKWSKQTVKFGQSRDLRHNCGYSKMITIFLYTDLFLEDRPFQRKRRRRGSGVRGDDWAEVSVQERVTLSRWVFGGGGREKTMHSFCQAPT